MKFTEQKKCISRIQLEGKKILVSDLCWNYIGFVKSSYPYLFSWMELLFLLCKVTLNLIHHQDIRNYTVLQNFLLLLNFSFNSYLVFGWSSWIHSIFFTNCWNLREFYHNGSFFFSNTKSWNGLLGFRIEVPMIGYRSAIMSLFFFSQFHLRTGLGFMPELLFGKSYFYFSND